MKMEPVLAGLLKRIRIRLLLSAGVSAALLLTATLTLGAQWPAWAQLSSAVVLLAALAAWTEHWWRRLEGQSLAEHLNRRWPVLEDSAQLLLATPPAGPLAARQAARVALTLGQQPIPGALPRGARRGLLLVLASSLVMLLAPRFAALLESDEARSVARLTSHRVLVSPPAYTGLPPRRESELALSVVEGSRLDWELNFTGAVDQVWLEFDNAEPAAAEATGPGHYRVEQRLISNQVYSVTWRAAGRLEKSEPQLIRIVRDRPPSISVQSPEFSPVETREPARETLEFAVEGSDDFGLRQAVILATVAKGDGEGVKFRDVELPFDRSVSLPAPGGIGQSRRYTRRWDLEQLGMEPGDELYFRARITDSREPVPNSAQTPVMMLRWLAPRARSTFALQGLAVDILPEYFRSQRQIIIDTEKLVSERNRISAVEGVSRSRSLALDQKSLRIRYGQYLGEEYESDIGLPSAGSAELDEDHADETFAEHLGHAHDEHAGAGHDHGGAGGPDPGASQGTTVGGLPGFMADFVHAHDSAEQATLFDEKTRETLKAALAEMWQSELNLHLSQPAEALPFQYQALTLLKQVQQANRIYVRRAGFEPPPLDEGKRLTGDPDDSADSLARWSEQSPQARRRQRLAGLLTDLAAGRPGDEELSWLAEQAAGDADSNAARLAAARLRAGPCRECLVTLQAVAWRALGPLAPAANVRRTGPRGGLAQAYFAPLENAPRSGSGSP